MPEYPFPCDTDELNRQTTKTLLAISLLGTPSLSRSIHNPPTRVLEVGCGTGLWSSLCHQHFIRLGAAPIKFFGTDIAPVSPNLRGHGVDWEFLQHDLTKALPYWDESFDLIIVKDLAFIARPDAGEARLLDEYFRILRRGGTLEIWESDLPIRALLPPALHTRRIVTPAARQAERTGSYLLGPEIGFSESRNKCIREFNGWIRDSLEDRGLNPSPSTEMGALLLGERRFAKGSTSCHRVAIPLGEAKWEQDPSTELRSEPPGSRPSSSYKRIEDLKIPPLTAHQLSLRSTALSLAVQTIESLEPILKKAAALNGDNWDRWWDEMMSSLLDEKNTSSGECLEFGVWWGTKA